MDPILSVQRLVKYFSLSSNSFLHAQTRIVHAVDDVSFDVMRGETFSLVGETGSGKTTVAKILAGLIQPTSGEVYFEGNNLFHARKKEFKKIRPKIQMIFQDPYSSLNPRKRIGDIVTLPIRANSLIKDVTKLEIAAQLLDYVGLTPSRNFLNKYPHELSGGQRQRVGIARALALNPELVIADEPTSALDASIKSQILNLLRKLKQDRGFSFFTISHDLATVRYLSTTVAVMHLGRIVELSESEALFNNPEHPYTQALISAVPKIGDTTNTQKLSLKGEMPSPIDPPKGCRFRTRCPFAQQVCTEKEPQLREIEKGHLAACHFPKSERGVVWIEEKAN